MSITIGEQGEHCSNASLPSVRDTHGICGADENLHSDRPEEPTGGPCGLCGEPTFPRERGVHTLCAKIENFSSDS